MPTASLHHTIDFQEIIDADAALRFQLGPCVNDLLKVRVNEFHLLGQYQSNLFFHLCLHLSFGQGAS